jgi:hypothetical protein
MRQISLKYKKKDQQGRVAFNVRNTNTDKQHRTTGKGPSSTLNKNRTGHKAKHGRGDPFKKFIIGNN